MWISVFDLMSDRKLIRPGAGVMPRILDIGIWGRIEGIYYRGGGANGFLGRGRNLVILSTELYFRLLFRAVIIRSLDSSGSAF